MKIITLTIALVSIVASCAPMKQKSTTAPIKLSTSQFVNYYLTINAEDKIEQYGFSDDGIALAWRGNNDGALQLVYDWKIIDDQTLQLKIKKGLDGPVYAKKIIEDHPFISEIGRSEINEPRESLKTIRLRFSSITSSRAITTDGKVFKREKIRL